FYVRDEYRELDVFVEEQKQSDVARRDFRTPILLIGQPGIGAWVHAGLSLHNHAPKRKSGYLMYCLVNRLAEGKPTVLSNSHFMCFTFISSGVYKIP
ncbi:uncharacterized protein EI90DRAFT_2870363, partial [Cantharellus anzutake]|uniref:uncharacterized protein n=1 Tax=Cantharellus anzutake TaxID=1750568 RepID=UPI001904DC29